MRTQFVRLDKVFRGKRLRTFESTNVSCEWRVEGRPFGCAQGRILLVEILPLRPIRLALRAGLAATAKQEPRNKLQKKEAPPQGRPGG